ncbi:hypothetical protein L5515_000087 [Caenorhabditis briggsae]|uniref:Uncharacterized protein n=1 Tax=Caenorhabditis briggsae TaxID=6238 RepID=A0AAE9DPD2_CAEBR|nr:hypothetical protein L3Y34_013993 [Caenorhabditis briggsae]UMM10205.1 hypothetical protein L5515_000087 [Caenorhabditis briggsae]
MFRAIFDAFNFSSEASEDDVPFATPKEDCDEDGWVVNVQLPEDSGEESFAMVENPEIMEMGDDEESVICSEVVTTVVPELEAIKRREAYNQARAKTAFRNHLESVMFADPESGKDVRTTKTGHGSNRSGVSSTSNSIRRLNTQSQRSKKSSGKSNDRKTHKISDLSLAD